MISATAAAQGMTVRPTARWATLGRIVPRLVWTAALLTTVAGALAGMSVTLATNGPPHEAAAMALAYAIVVAPYLFVARALDQLMR